jgi:hydrogenase maturation protease
MAAAAPTILLLGFGNPGRRDDGLGPALAEAAREWNLPGVTIDSDYQLTVEDAAEAARHQIVLFADAAVTGPDPFWIERLDPTTSPGSFSTHRVTPGAVLALARELFSAAPTGYLLAIRGYEFDQFDEGLSEKARENLKAAVSHLRAMLKDGHIRIGNSHARRKTRHFVHR